MSTTIDLRVSETLTEDVGKGLARLDPEDIKALGGVLGDLIEMSGEKKTVARITGTFPEHYGKKIIQIDGITRSNAEVNLGEIVRIKKIPYKIATTVLITPLDLTNVVPEGSELEQFPKILQGLPVLIGDRINVPFLTGKDRFFMVEATSPSGGVLINSKTKFLIKKPDYLVEAPSHVSYEDVGGLGNELKLIREMVELPLRYVEVFEKLGVEAPKGVLIYGPPGTGKTLIARAIASETKLHFIRVNGPEIIHKFYGESEARLREIFEDATRNAPSIIFIDEIDAIAPKRAEVLGDVEKRVVAQLLALMDGMVSRGQVIVIGATNIPEMIDPALRRPGRFDREMALPVPNVEGRQAILRIHSRRMPLASDVDLERLAQITHAFVGADLEALCKEAGMVAVRRYLPLEGGNHLDAMLINPDHLEIRMEDFLTALREIEPSATREFYTERSKVQWHDIGGLKGIKETLLSIVDWPHKFPELFDEGKVVPPKGVLFSGPSGTGKTLMAKALAGETGLNFISISGPILFSKWLGESEKALHQIFKKAKQSAPCILFFDEIDALVTTRGDGSEGGAVERVASQFFNELDNLSDLSQVLVLGATNRKDLLDPALTRTGRLDYILNFPIPNEEERLEILRVHTKERPLADDVNLTDLAKRTSGMTGSHIAFVAKRAVLLAIGELIYNSGKSKTRKLSVTASHFEDALKEVQSREGLPHVEGS
ncbi:MAG TPA: CDC48 family AAA ATPase [Thermodesulfobacteriota bacterium]|nr:CDC48 family AAA ATPase [Thermodesulfobacteriota bacterium]